jgi:hypothetical protein
MDISGGMPAVLIKMLVASDPGKISLLPALPSKWSAGSIEGVLCRGQIEIKSLSWDQNSIVASIVSGKDQKISLELPSKIANISIKEGSGQAVEKGKDNIRVISLQKDELLTIHISL